MTESYTDPEVLVSTDWVAEHLNEPSIVIAEVNTDLQAGYYQGHVPGAVGWGLHADLEDQLRRDIPTVSQIEELLGALGNRQRHHCGGLRRRQQPLSHVGLLGPKVLPARGRAADGRGPQKMDS